MSITLPTHLDTQSDVVVPVWIYPGALVRVGTGSALWSIERLEADRALLCSYAGTWRTVATARLRPVTLAPEPYDPWQHARVYEAMGWSIVWVKLPFKVNGITKFDERVIELADDLLWEEAICTLAHELVHVERGYMHRVSTSAVDVDETETEREATRRLIPFEALVEAVGQSPDPSLVTRILGVTLDALNCRLEHLSGSEARAIRAARVRCMVSDWWANR
ncbi:hypothetical protein IEE94_11475 [Yimella sp. cx-573]|nr:hypothetical protein [Yimella sp. cx-573]